MQELRVLTVRQPWAWAIVHGGKDVENRVRNIAGAYRGPIAIHAGLAFDQAASFGSIALKAAMDSSAVAAGADVFSGGYMWDLGTPDPRKAWGVHGAIVGVVDLVEVHHSTMYCFTALGQHDNGEIEFARPCSPWALDDSHHLVLANPRPLREPIPFKGALGLRRLPVEVAEQVWEGVE